MKLKACVAALLGGWCVWNGSVSGQDLPPSAPYYALSYWTFSDTNDWTSDLGSKPLSYSNLGVSELGDGTALVVDSTNAAWLAYPVIDGDLTNLVIGAPGSVAFWFAPSWSGTNMGGPGPGMWGRLIEAGTYTTNASIGWWSLYTDPAGCNLYFSAQTNNGLSAVYLSAPIAWTTNKWHFVTLTYSSTNASLYLDGTLATNQASGVTLSPPASALTNGFSIGSSGNGSNQAHGMFDDLESYGYVLSAHTISNFFNGSGVQYWANPLNSANLASAPYDPPYPSPGFRAIMGTGYVHLVSFATNCATNLNVWMTNVTAELTNNGTMDLTFTIGGGAPDVAYDVFATGGLVGNSITNAQWYWLGQGYACSTYVITNLPGTTAMFVLGTPQDSDGDGLTDAYEVLVSKTDPHNLDTYGNGWPDWWQVVHYGTNVVDPFGDSDGDGWTNLQEYQRGTDPNHFDTPPPPQNVTAKVDASGTNITITWTSGGGPVTNYVIERTFNGFAESSASSIGSVASNVFSFADTSSQVLFRDPYSQPEYFVRANFANGSSAVSGGATVSFPALSTAMTIVRGPGGNPYMVLASPPSDFSNMLLFWKGDSFPNSNSISATNFVNGVAALPSDAASSMPPMQTDFAFQLFGASSGFSESYLADANPINGSANEEAWGSSSAYSFVDARRHLKENLMFLLRSAGRNTAFGYAYPQEIFFEGGSYSSDTTAHPETDFVRPLGSTNYEYYGFHYFSPSLNCSVREELRPVQENFLWSNFVFNASTYLDGNLGYALDCPLVSLRLLNDPLNASYAGSGTESNVPVALVNSSAQWLYYGGIWPDEDSCGLSRDVGIGTNGAGKFLMSSGGKNCFGLNFESAQVDYGTSPLEPGTPGNVTDGGYSVNCWPQTDIPSLETVDYFFVSQTPYFNFNAAYGTPRPPLPGSPDFTVTNTSPLLITGLGQSMNVAGWAKQAILNGYSNKFAYLEQYFDKAYMMGTNGAADTNKPTGVLSPYGDFMPTDPGAVALITMPDIDTGQRGTGVVNVIKLQLDVNHDGVMDLSLSGPDNTFQDRPFVFWINNDLDLSNDLTNDPGKDVEPLSPSDIDSELVNIDSQRDLEDFARLWIVGMPSLSPSNGYQITLGWNVITGSPAISLVSAVETNGGVGYLTNTDVALAQIATDGHGSGPGHKFAYVGPLVPYTFPSDFFTNGATKYLLFEGAGAGAGQLVLTIKNGSNVVAQTSAWLELHDVQDFFEQAYATNVTSSKPPSSLVSDFGIARHATTIAQDETNQIVVFIHGINNTVADYEASSATIYKRLYWSGYRGRFAAFRWPCAYLYPTARNPFLYNLGEFFAFKSGTALRNYLSSLKSDRPDLAGYAINLYAHSQGNVVTSEALLQGAPFDNYILSQGAFPAHCYDTNAPFLQKLLDAETNSVNAVQTPFYPVDGGYHGYCSPIHGNLINFFNTNDFALASGVTAGLQTNWEENQRTQKPEAFLGGPSYIYAPSTHITTGYYTFGSYTVTDLQEIKALVARSRSRAVGAQGGLGGVINGEVNLQDSFDFGKTRSEHSAQFNRPIQTSKGYWDEVVRTFSPATP